MKFRGFDIDPTSDCAKRVNDEVVRRVGEILERENLAGRVPEHKFLRVVLANVIEPGISLAAAHSVWAAEYFGKIGTPGGFPRQKDETVCDDGLVLVGIDCVVEMIGGMGYWDFAGYFLSLLVSLPEGRIWDARGESVP